MDIIQYYLFPNSVHKNKITFLHKNCCTLIFLVCFGLFWFYGILIIVGYLTENPVFTYTSNI